LPSPIPHFRSLTLGLLICLGIAACGPGNPGPTGDSSPPPRNTLTIGILVPINTLNPVTITSPDEQNFANFVWAGLLGVNPSGHLFPMLAQSVPTAANGLISPDGTSITFLLRRGLKWSDGAPITSADVKFGYNVAVRRWAVLCPAVCWAVRKVTTSRPRSVTFQLTRPYSPLLFDLPPVLPRHQMWKGNWRATFLDIYKSTTNFLAPHFAVDGPYVARATSPRLVTFVRNPHWTILKRPAFARVIVQTFPGDRNLVEAVRSGAVELSQGYYDLDFNRNRQILTPAAIRGLHMTLAPLTGLEHLELNITGRWVQNLPGRRPRYLYVNTLGDPRVRQALALAINRLKVFRAAYALSRERAKRLLAATPEQPNRFDGFAASGTWDPIKRRFVHHPQIQDARLLLKRAGWFVRKDGYRYRRGCRITAPRCQLNIFLIAPKGDYARLQEILTLQTMWQRIGVNLTYDDAHWSDGNLTGSYRENGPCARGWEDICVLAQLPGPDPQTDYQLEFTSTHVARLKRNPTPADINYSGIRNPALDHIFATAGAVYDLNQRAALYRQWQLMVMKQAFWIPLFYRPQIAVSRIRLDHFHPTAAGQEWNPWALRRAR